MNSDAAQMLVDLEIIVRRQLTDLRDILLNMNNIQTTYINTLERNNAKLLENPRFKPYLKKLSLEIKNDNICFNKSSKVYHPEQLMAPKA